MAARPPAECLGEAPDCRVVVREALTFRAGIFDAGNPVLLFGFSPMALEIVAQEAAEIVLPWLQPLNIRDGSPARIDFSLVKVEAGSSLYLDEGARRFRTTSPAGFIRAWDGFRELRVDPGKFWSVSWHAQTYDYPRFGFAHQDGAVSLQMSNMEDEEHLFADFVALMGDTQLNPAGLPFEDGDYSSEDGFEFTVAFGRDGSEPQLSAIEYFEPVDPVLPAKFVAEISDGAAMVETQDKQTVQVPRGLYHCHIVGWNFKTGEVYIVQFDGPRYFQSSGSEIIRLINEKKLAIAHVVQRQMDRF
ncbi:MAG: hypothetical protein NVV83_22110 [Afipia sp.]|nr:hypothetical protein [Afipia sp.]